MIKSMTGYGGTKDTVSNITVSAEIKSVNNRFLDVSVRLPKNCLFAEEDIRASVAEVLSRGKADVYITVDTSAADHIEINVNDALAEAYSRAVASLAEKYSLKNDLTALSLARFPEILTEKKDDTDRGILQNAILSTLKKALCDYDAMRVKEGEKLCRDVWSRLAVIEQHVAVIETRSPETVAEYRRRLTEKMKEVLAESAVDEARILQEAAIYADKIAVDEETVRLRSHIEQFRAFLTSGSPIGRKLDFLVQEMNRESNTIGSKCQDIEISGHVIDIKAEIEKIREQIQNIE